MRLCPRHAASVQELMTAKKTLADGHEQCERNQAVGKGSVGGTRQPTQIGASPDEFVPFGANDPGAVIVKLELGLDLGRDFDCEGTALRRAAGYPQHRHMRQRRKVGPSSPRRAPRCSRFRPGTG